MTKIHCEPDIENQIATIAEKQCFICTYNKSLDEFKSCSTCSKQICLDCIYNLNKHNIKKCPFCKQTNNDFIIKNNDTYFQNHLVDIRIVHQNNEDRPVSINKKMKKLFNIIVIIYAYIIISGIAGLVIKVIFGFKWNLLEYVSVGCAIFPGLYLSFITFSYVKKIIKDNLIRSELITEY